MNKRKCKIRTVVIRRQSVILLRFVLGFTVLAAGCDNAIQDETAPVYTPEISNASPTPVTAASTAAAPIPNEPSVQAVAYKSPPRPMKMPREAYPPMLHIPMDDDAESPDLKTLPEEKPVLTFLDLSGTPNSSAHSVEGVFGTALSFDGIDDLFEIPASQVGAAFAPDKDFSVAFWWRSDSDPFPDGYREVVSSYTRNGGGIILSQRGSADGSFKRIYMNCYVPGNGAPVLTPVTDVAENVGQWHHYVFQREGSTLRTWRDGRLRGEFTDPSVTGEMGSTTTFRVNANNAGAKGAMDDLRIYTRALSASQIRTLAAREPAVEDVFSLAEALHDLQASPAADATEIARIEEALADHIQAEKNYPKAIGDKVELLAFRFNHVESDEYEMSIAFRTKTRLTKDYQIYVHGRVDASHARRIAQYGGGPNGLQKWGFLPTEPTSTWPPGQVIVVRNWVRAGEVPYQMSINFLDAAENYEPLIPKFALLGWYASF